MQPKFYSPLCNPSSPVSTEFSTPWNQIACVTFDVGKNPSSSIEGKEARKVVDNSQHFCSKGVGTVRQDIPYKNKQLTKAKSVRTYRKLFACDAGTSSLSAGTGPVDSTNFQGQSIITNTTPVNRTTPRAFCVNTGHGSFRGPHASLDSNASTYGDSDLEGVKSASETGASYFKDFISGVKRSAFEAKLEYWKETKSGKLMNKLRKKEAKINAWEIKESTKARVHLKKIETKLERRRLIALEKMQIKIRSAQKKADKKKAKERRSTAMKILKISTFVQKVTAAGKLSWWR